jgi:hypothetical protein
LPYELCGVAGCNLLRLAGYQGAVEAGLIVRRVGAVCFSGFGFFVRQSGIRGRDATLSGLGLCGGSTQGSFATLGYLTQPRWGRGVFPCLPPLAVEA